MRSSTLAPLVGSRSFWERKLSCLKSSKCNLLPRLNHFPVNPEIVKVPRQDRGLLPNTGRQIFVENEVSIQWVHWGPEVDKNLQLRLAPKDLSSHDLKVCHNYLFLYGVEMALCIKHPTSQGRH